MAGTIVGIAGMQRSGKTLWAYKFAKMVHVAYGIPVYTNLYCPKDTDFHYINSLTNFPLDLSPKILLLDEIYNGTDAQDFRKLKEISIFLNTIGKQNCLFIYTTIDPAMVFNRLRNQTQIFVAVKSNSSFIFYKIFNLVKNNAVSYCVQKNPKLFKDVFYDTNFIPLDFDWNMDNWKEKLSLFYKQYYGIDISI